MIIAMSVLTSNGSMKTNYTFNIKALSFDHAISKVETLFHYYDRSIDIKSIQAMHLKKDEQSNHFVTVSKRRMVGKMNSCLSIGCKKPWFNMVVNVDVLTGR